MSQLCSDNMNHFKSKIEMAHLDISLSYLVALVVHVNVDLKKKKKKMTIPNHFICYIQYKSENEFLNVI